MPSRVFRDFLELKVALLASMRAKPAAVFRGVRHAFLRDAAAWEAAMTESFTGEPVLYPGRKSASDPLSGRSGLLRDSIQTDVSGDGLDTLTLRKFSTSHYAITHELGTQGAGGELPDIVPVRAKWLALPMEAAMLPSGVPRLPGPRAWDDLWFMRTKSDGLFLVRGTGETGIEFLYHLRKKVAIPPRLGMRKRHNARAEKRVKEIGRLVRSEMRKATG